MKNTLTIIVATLLLLYSGNAKSQTMNNLTVKEQKIVAASAATARSDMQTLTSELNAALDAGVSINEMKEVLCQLYAYSGFPKSLNALATFQNVLKTRSENGIKDTEGRLPNPLPAGKSVDFGTANQTELCGREIKGALFDFAPAIDYYLKAHLFGDIFGRDNLDWRTREIATIAALAAMPGVESQRNSHIEIGKHNGLTDAQVAEILAIAQPSFQQDFPLGEKNTAYAKYFTGQSYLAPLTTHNSEHSVPMFNVTFEPGCRNNWHSHTGGQILVVTAGKGWYQERGKAAQALKAGDVVEIPANVEHWHGAAADSWFSHLAIECNPQTNKNTWLEAVSDEEYGKLGK